MHLHYRVVDFPVDELADQPDDLDEFDDDAQPKHESSSLALVALYSTAGS